MEENDKKTPFIRWYDKDEAIASSMKTLENAPDKLKRQIATYLIEEVISRKPYCDMFPLDTHYLILSENRRRRWYDYDETVRIFIELLRHSSESQQKAVFNMVDAFITSLMETYEPDEDEEQSSE